MRDSVVLTETIQNKLAQAKTLFKKNETLISYLELCIPQGQVVAGYKSILEDFRLFQKLEIQINEMKVLLDTA